MAQYVFNDPARPVDFKESSIITALKKGNLIATPKADGVRMHIIINAQAQAFIRSRADIAFPALKELEARLNADWLQDLRVDLQGCTIEGEAVVIQPDGSESRCEATSGTLRRLEQLPPGRVAFYHFDTYSEETKGLGKVDRIQHKRTEALELIRFVFLPRSLATYRAASIESLNTFYEACRSQGWEGCVAVVEKAGYTNGKKVGAGWKVKPEVTVEGHITGLVEAKTPEGKPLGMVGSFLADFEDGTKGTPGAGAMTHDERRHCWENQEETIGRIAEFNAMEKFAKGGFRHPSWKMWRDALDNKGVKQ